MKMILGIDISKNYLDVAYRQGKTYGHQHYDQNDFGSAAVIAKDFEGHELHVVMEVTGTYGMKLAHGFYELGIPVSMVNPLCIKRFGQMKLRRSKTDAYDACLIAEYGETQDLELWHPKAKEQECLAQIMRTMADLQKMKTELKNRQEAASKLAFREQSCESALASVLSQVQSEIAHLKDQMKEILQQAFHDANIRLQSIPGVGEVTAGAILAHCGQFELFQRASQAVAFAGLNPSPHQSGTSVRGRGGISKRGHADLRALLYMGALSAIRYNEPCRALYLRLLEKGKPKRVALVAVAHKLLRQAFGVLKGGTTFQQNYSEIGGILHSTSE
jgi:transposase